MIIHAVIFADQIPHWLWQSLAHDEMAAKDNAMLSVFRQSAQLPE